ncbi:hypothetical protein ACZ91_30360 [Streptomyces regensis]|nr:hypothetical protein ACZ91_30360 [Streptomyces regensis]KOG63396.1 hypothetical protein ADK77_23720 [Streptomyces antibioticus]
MEIVQDRSAARQREQRNSEGLCPEHGSRLGPLGLCATCELDDAAARPAPTVVHQRAPDGRRAAPTATAARILLTGRTLGDGLCGLCREEAAALAADHAPPTSGVTADRVCTGRDGRVPCSRAPLASRSVCAHHRVQEDA